MNEAEKKDSVSSLIFIVMIFFVVKLFVFSLWERANAAVTVVLIIVTIVLAFCKHNYAEAIEAEEENNNNHFLFISLLTLSLSLSHTIASKWNVLFRYLFIYFVERVSSNFASSINKLVSHELGLFFLLQFRSSSNCILTKLS